MTHHILVANSSIHLLIQFFAGNFQFGNGYTRTKRVECVISTKLNVMVGIRRPVEINFGRIVFDTRFITQCYGLCSCGRRSCNNGFGFCAHTHIEPVTGIRGSCIHKQLIINYMVPTCRSY